MAHYHAISITQKDFELICRTCLRSENVTSIFQSLVENIEIQDLLAYSVEIQVSENDLMPQNICDNCLTNLYGMYKFKKECQENEAILKSLLQNEKGEVKIEEEFSSNSNSDAEDLQDKVSCGMKENSHEKKPKTIDLSKTKLRYSCTCGERFSTKQELFPHQRQTKHGSYREIQCAICGKVMPHRMLSQHMRNHSNEKPYKCKICSTGFKLSCNLRRHEMSHTGECPYICNVCGKGFTRTANLQGHLKRHESSKRSYSCKYCGRGFKILTMYHKHMQKHNGIVTELTEKNGNEKQRPFLCEVCSFTFITKRTLMAHMLTHGEKNFLCSVCGKAFHREQLLMTHSRVHTGERPYSCNVCQKSFKQITTLETHKLNHTGEKPHKCSYCPKTFRQRPHLKYHIRTHTGQKPYSCVFCEKSFASTGTLQVHVRTHTGVKPYLCPICDKGFYDSTGMNKHRKLHDKKVETASNANDCENIVTETVVYKIEKD